MFSIVESNASVLSVDEKGIHLHLLIRKQNIVPQAGEGGPRLPHDS